jgi:hypothetical protein
MPEASCGSSPSHLHQGRIEARFVLVQRETEAGTHAFALELNRDEDQGRPVRARAVLRRPFQETEAQIEDVGAAFLEGEPGGPVEIGEAPFQFGVGDVGMKVAALHRIQDEVLASVLVLAVGEQRRVAAVAAVEHGGLAEQLETLAVGQPVFQRRGIGALDRDGRHRVFEVEQPVPQREVEKVALPDFEPVEVLLGHRLATLVKVLFELRDFTDLLGCRCSYYRSDRRLCLARQVEWTYLGAACAAHIDREFEGRGGVLCDQFLGCFDCLLEAPGVRACQQGSLDYDHFLQLHAFAQHLGVVNDEP